MLCQDDAISFAIEFQAMRKGLVADNSIFLHISLLRSLCVLIGTHARSRDPHDSDAAARVPRRRPVRVALDSFLPMPMPVLVTSVFAERGPGGRVTFPLPFIASQVRKLLASGGRVHVGPRSVRRRCTRMPRAPREGKTDRIVFSRSMSVSPLVSGVPLPLLYAYPASQATQMMSMSHKNS